MSGVNWIHELIINMRYKTVV